MSDDLNKKIQQVAEALGQDNMPDNVKSLLAMLAGSLSGKNETSEKPEKTPDHDPETDAPAEKPVPEKPTPAGPAIDADILLKVRKILDRANSASDPRINLLHAIQPFMGSRRQKKLGNCIQLLQMASLTKLMNDKEK